ncbi:hypothetical protein RJ640_000521, partial [Escallonia rubra]
MEASIAASSVFPGFRFCPTDEELISYYLKKKLDGCDKSVQVIPEVDICRYEPWDLPDSEWFFFSARGRKYPNGSQSKRATDFGYWKATGKERNVKSGSNVIGTKRTLVFHTGRAPKGKRTEWIMHEYCMSGNSQDSVVVCRLRKNNDFCLNDSPRDGSLNQRHLVNGDADNYALEDGIQQTGVLEEAKTYESCSKECTSGYNSHSVEQVNTGSESDERLMDGFPQHASSSHQKDYDAEDEWFADIMKDDIIKLDESSLPTSPNHIPLIARHPKWDIEPKAERATPLIARAPKTERTPEQELQGVTSSVLPSQGTANRRIRLRRLKTTTFRSKSLEANEKPSAEQGICSPSHQPQK